MNSRTQKIFRALETQKCSQEKNNSQQDCNISQNNINPGELDDLDIESLPIVLADETLNYDLVNELGIEINLDFGIPLAVEQRDVNLEEFNDKVKSSINVDNIACEESQRDSICNDTSNSLEHHFDADHDSEIESDDRDYESGQEKSDHNEDNLNLQDNNKEVDYGNMNDGRKRQKIARPDEWKRNKNRELRMKGKEFIGFSRNKNKDFKHNVPRSARNIGERCLSKMCLKSKKRFCNTLSEDIREDIFNNFWKQMTWDQRKVFVSAHVSLQAPSRKTTEENSRRGNTLMYRLHNGKELVQVCRNTFLNTTGLGRFTVESWVKSSTYGMNESKSEKKNEMKNVDENVWKNHIDDKNKARKEQADDKAKAIKTECILLCMDLQAVKVAPSLNATKIYFKTNLGFHNFTIYNTASHQATTYWFTEIDCGLTAPTFVSCLIDYLERHCLGKGLPIIIFSDGCTFQKRNNVLSNSLLNFAIIHGISITQKYLTKGHTQMECDSVHSCIERKLKNRVIQLPSDYVKASMEARTKPGPYELQHDFFKDYARPEFLRYSGIRPSRDALVTDIKALHYDPNGVIRFKLDFNEEFQDLPSRPKDMAPVLSFPKLYKNRLPITQRKWKDLQDLKSVISQDCHLYYDSLPFTQERAGQHNDVTDGNIEPPRKKRKSKGQNNDVIDENMEPSHKKSKSKGRHEK